MIYQKKKRISWLTPESFIDVDLPVIKYLKTSYRIRLIIILHRNEIDYVNYVGNFIKDSNEVEIIWVHLTNRSRNLKNVFHYNRILDLARSFKPDLFYISFMGVPYALPLYIFRLPMKKCVVVCHNVSTPKGASNEIISKIYNSLWLWIFKNIQVFSNSQYEILRSRYKNKNILMAPLMIKDYGNPSCQIVKEEPIKFLFFGNIRDYKRLDLLIDAANILVSQGISNFRVVIAGNCNNWSKYGHKIEHPELFDIRIGRIPNEEIADIFAKCHFFVMPYQDIAQSGAITVAFRYNLPTIVSDIPQFDDLFIDGETGFKFKSLDPEALAETMRYSISLSNEKYNELQFNQKMFVEKRFSDESIVNMYKNYFELLME